LTVDEVSQINVVLDVATLESAARDTKGIF